MSIIIERTSDGIRNLEQQTQQPRPQSNYLPREQSADRHVVIPDIHGEHKVLQRIIDSYENEADIDFVFLGDILDRKGKPGGDPERGVFKSLDLIKELGNRAILTMANHEWFFHASSFADDPIFRQSVTKEWLGNHANSAMEQNVLSSYGLDPNIRTDTTSKQLRRRMVKAAHLGILTNASPFYETDSFIATHAGIMPGVPWDMQKNYLLEVAKEMDEGLFYDRPPQWFSMKLATSTEPITHTHKTVVSGHAHVLGQSSKRYPDQSKDRVLHNGKRIRLASTLNAPTNAAAYVWQDWDKRIVEVPTDNETSH